MVQGAVLPDWFRRGVGPPSDRTQALFEQAAASAAATAAVAASKDKATASAAAAAAAATAAVAASKEMLQAIKEKAERMRARLSFLKEGP